MRKKNYPATILIVILLALAINFSSAQTVAELQNLLNEGVACYNAEKYWDAQQIFQTINSAPIAENPFLTTSALMLIKTNYRLGEAERSLVLAREFLNNYPDSRYIKEVKVTLAEALLSLGKYPATLNLYLDLLENYSDPETQAICEDHLDKIIDFYLDVEAVKAVRDSSARNFPRQYLTLKIAEQYHAAGNSKLAQSESRNLPNRLENRYLRERLQETETRLKKEPIARKYIGVILPLTGANSSSGQKILDGVKYAIDNYRKNNAADIVALVMDNRGDPVQSLKQAELLAKNQKVLAIFGPMSTENATLVAVAANQYQIPMITPTASGTQLASLGPYVFQANVDYENLGYFMGMYGAKVNGLRTVASISPADEFGKEFTDAFCRAVDDYGGQVISQQWYHGRPSDLKYQINKMHLAAIDHATKHFNAKFNLAKKQLAELVSTDSKYFNDTLRIAVGDEQCLIFKPDTIYRRTLEETLIMTGLMKSADFETHKRDTTAFPAGLVDGFLFPARANDPNLLVPQLTYYEISGNLFGSANWNEPELIMKNWNILRNLRFISDSYLDPESEEYRQLADDFAKTFQREPERMELYGYDTMNALLSVINEGATERDSVRQGLMEMPVYRGICRNISFRGNRPRVNSCAFILGYNEDKIKPVAIIENGQIIN